jgi:hypothetical protein
MSKYVYCTQHITSCRWSYNSTRDRDEMFGTHYQLCIIFKFYCISLKFINRNHSAGTKIIIDAHTLEQV